MNRIDELEGAIARLSECRQQLSDISRDFAPTFDRFRKDTDGDFDFNKSLEVVDHHLLVLKNIVS